MKIEKYELLFYDIFVYRLYFLDSEMFCCVCMRMGVCWLGYNLWIEILWNNGLYFFVFIIVNKCWLFFFL